MRIALISDIHGNDIALEAVLKDIKQSSVDQIFFLGDIATLGPNPCRAIEILRELNCTCIMGNHDAFMLSPGLIQKYTGEPVILDAVDWCRHQLAEPDLEFIGSFRPLFEVPLDDDLVLLLYHGSPRSYVEDILATTPSEVLDEILDGFTATVMAGGHTHLQMLRQHHGMLMVNPGSVGLPFKDFVNRQRPQVLPHAEYAIVDASHGNIEIALRRLPLDKKLLREAAHASKNPFRAMLLEHYA